jgi:hypothetical protein
MLDDLIQEMEEIIQIAQQSLTPDDLDEFIDQASISLADAADTGSLYPSER